MVICTKVAEPRSAGFNRKDLAAFSAAFFVGYSSSVPIHLFPRRPPAIGLGFSPSEDPNLFATGGDIAIGPPRWIRVLCIISSFR
jgi:hypothetical protein